MPLLEYDQLLQKMSVILNEQNRSQHVIAIVLIDFVGLSELDGILGFPLVDMYLKQAGENIVSALPDSDLVGCVGRHNLACLFSVLPSKGHAEIAGHKLLRILSSPFVHNSHRLTIAVRIGIALAENLTDTEELLRQANSAMHQAIREREHIKIYTPEFDAMLISEYSLLNDLDKAIEDSRIFIVYQPQYSLKTNQLIGAEALLRWNHPEKGIIPPNRMVQLAEQTGLITKLTFWVFNTALRQCSEYRKAGLDISVSVNFSSTNLREPDLVDIVSQALEMWNVPPEHVVIELTENAIMDEGNQTMTTLNRFKKMGLQIAMDDFGTGYSSMSLLQKLPIDEIKIDLSFVKNMMINPEKEHLVKTIIELAHNLGMRVVAEGVEDEHAFARLKEMQCDIIQGYYIGKPLKLPDFIDLAKRINHQ